MTDFFDTVDPLLYDQSLPYVVPGVAMARTMRKIAFDRIVERSTDWIGADIGIGTGSDLATLLSKGSTGKIYGIDDSPRLTSKLSRSGRLPNVQLRSVSLTLEICDFAENHAFKSISATNPNGLDFVSSAFAIHNVPHERQEIAFKNVASILKIGSPFFYLDLVSYAEANLRVAADLADLAFIETEMNAVPPGIDEYQWQKLQTRWIEHYQHENFLLPLTSPDKASVSGMLADAGFAPPEILFRMHNTTLLLARRVK
jgi:ubiquinone/menaquinone biosynthesis C-methylase UbiE